MKDFLDQLADMEVCEPPPEFNRQLHDRVNRTLLVQHLVDLVLGAAPWALAHLARSVAAWFAFTLTGKFDDQRRPK